MSKQPDSTLYPMSEAVRAAYRAGQEDETLEPLVLVEDGQPVGRIQGGDYVIFYDIRGEREVELTASFVEPGFHAFPVAEERPHFVTMIQYDPSLPVRVAFPPPGDIRNTLGEVVSQHGLSHAKICESEKAIHVSFFLNGKRSEPFPGEERIVVPSPHGVDNYALVPELSADGVGKATIQALLQGQHPLIITNFANVDVVGHIEDARAVKLAVEAVDYQIGRLIQVARRAGYTSMVTADHGTVEKWLYPDGAVDTGHTDSPVPFILIPPEDGVDMTLRQGGSLIDVAPTALQLLHLPVPTEMTGTSLLQSCPEDWLASEHKLLLIIADGWGWRDQAHGNMIAQAYTPAMDMLQHTYPFATLAAAGPVVGMPEGSVGNSESGHLHLGAGRSILSDRMRIDTALQDGSLERNEAFLWAMQEAKRTGKRLHLLGIISFYSSHGSVDHLLALMGMAKAQGVPEVYIHGMLGRRGEQPESGANYVALVEEETQRLGLGRLVSVIGRFWSLDREGNWDRVERAYRQLVYGEGIKVPVGLP